MLKRDIAGNGNDSNTAFGDGSLHGNLEHARHLRRIRHQFAVMAALREEVFGISLLKISAANLPVRWASAPAANAATSSCLTPTQLMFCRTRIESVIPLSESPGTP